MPRTSRPLSGHPVMITGAASGIGRGLAQLLSRRGSPVAIADIDAEGLKQTAAAMSGPVLTRVLDVRDAADQLTFADEVREWLPAPLAAVFNNAGVAVSSSVLEAVPEDDEWLRQINFDGVVNGTRAFLPILVEQGSGAIVNTSSVYGLVGMPYQSAYCAAKFAVRGFTDALRQELRGTGVSAVTVHPGGIRTNIARNGRVRKDPEGKGRTKEQIAAEFEAMTMTTPEQAAEIICRGVERGKARILVGPDAYLFDTLARVTPTHYFDVLSVVMGLVRARAGKGAGQ
ncbi:SDR family NAD(P)-dependent oxidoreductase [Nocardia aurantiaca]|uniref:SDR family NAD(P)-dependent oxidoreductase n=1 Tax=Nocardia aurantiaca TaxID=2675850 RepID=A0A6I3L5U7_9NOCA|nr:SDR family oxidoreductase [Nocardia aurantiaca]MTE17267.1 SDR family NAD(P)-dependent oxidoreductase [Nocardia aurantiaca]